MELRLPTGRRARYRSAAGRRGLTLSEWARRHLDDAADADLDASTPSEPSDADVAESLRARGRFPGLRERVAALKKTPWS